PTRRSSDLKTRQNNYYPFGLKHEGYNDLPGDGYKYKFLNKEYEDSFGLNIYEMDMRQLDPAIGRWMVMDPVTHHDYSPYSAFDNNPVYWSDPSGADSQKYVSIADLFNNAKSGVTSFEFENGQLVGESFSKTIETTLEQTYLFLEAPTDDNGGGNGNGGGDPKKSSKSLQQHRKEAVSLNEWIKAYRYFSQRDIALERGKDKYGLPLGPSEKYRYVINPYDNNVMDMRHVVVVGYGMGDVNGLGAEFVQYLAGLFGKDPTNSAFNEQDKYSNNIGDSFRNYDYSKNGVYMSYDFAQRFGEFLKTVYNK